MSDEKKQPTEKMLNRLGRLAIPDERDKSFPMRTILPRTSRTYRYWWSDGWWGNQGNTPQCVAYAWNHWLEDGSVPQNHKEPPALDPNWLYKECQRNDQWRGENYDGTSVRAGAKICQREGYISEYRWAWDVGTIAHAILTTGPVVVGTNWYESMFYPDKDGNIKVEGAPTGGHAYILNGVNTKTGKFRLKNSWGRDWGKNGYAYISFADFQKLMDEQGEAALAVEIEKK